MSELFATAAVMSLTACGGGGGGGGATSPVAPAAATPSPAPAPATAPAPSPAPGSAPAPAPALSNADLVSTVSAATYGVGTVEKGAYDALNAQRSICGFGLLQQDIRLDLAAFKHADYLVQNSFIKNVRQIGHFEDRTDQFFYGNAPTDRATAAGFPLFAGSTLSVLENYTSNSSYSFATTPAYTASETLGAGKMRELMESVYHGRVSFGSGRSVGFGSEIKFGAYTPTAGGYQTQFRLVNEISADTNTQKLGTNAVATYPCQGAVVSGTFFPAVELPNPFPAVTDTSVAYGTPIYVKADVGATVVVTAGTLTKSDGTNVALASTITSSNDVNKEVTANEVFLVPTAGLAKGATYSAHLVGTVNGVAFTKDFSFSVIP